MKQLLVLLLNLLFIQCCYAQVATESRLLAATTFNSSGAISIPSDSTHYFYSSNRGGDYNHIQKFDSMFFYFCYHTPDNPNTANVYTVLQELIQTFDVNDNIITRMSQSWDTATKTFYYGTGTDPKDTFIYDNNNLITNVAQEWINNSWVNSTKHSYTYDGNGNILNDLIENWSTSTNAWINNAQYSYTYTGNKETNYVYKTWDLATSNWINNTQSSYTYDGNGNMLTDLLQNWGSTNTWVNISLMTYTYDAMNDQLTFLYQTPSGGTWINNSLDIYSVFAAQMPQIDSQLTWNNNAWVNNFKYIHTYNTYNQPTTETAASWNAGNWAIDGLLYHYYYEVYDLDVKSISNVNGTANIYPIPAHDVLHIDLQWNTPQACNIALYNMQGMLLKQWQTPATKMYHNNIAVNDLAAGNYLINITGVQGQIVRKLIIK